MLRVQVPQGVLDARQFYAYRVRAMESDIEGEM